MSAVSVDATPRRVNRTMSTISDSGMVVTEGLPRDSWTCLQSDLPQGGECAVSVDGAVHLVGGPASAFLSGADGWTLLGRLPSWWRPRPTLLRWLLLM